MMRSLVAWMMRSDLKRAFRQVVWVGPPPALPEDAPVVLYANHHHFYDGHLIQLLLERLLHRPGTIWMADWDRFPFFAAVGAQPFPPHDAARRRATVRRTVRRLRADARTVLVYFPEGRLHAPAEGLLPFPDGAFQRLARLFPAPTRWWPVALRIVQTGAARPTAFLAGGPVRQEAPDGHERERLRDVWAQLGPDGPAEAPARTLLDGASAPNERWDFSSLAPFFERYL